MNLKNHLRNRNSRQQSLMLLHERYPRSEIITVSSEDRYLQLSLNDDSGLQAQAWFDVDTLLGKMDVHLPDIPWREVPLNYLSHWLKAFNLNFLLNDQVWHVAQISVCAQSLSGQALMLSAEPCPIVCLDWPQDGHKPDKTKVITAEQIPFPLYVVLGYSRLNLSELIEVTPGDLLLIKRQDPHLAVGQRRLYRLSYYPHQEVVVEEKSTERDEMFREEGNLLDWASLPVEIEFVLVGRTTTLAELDKIGPGIALPLLPDAEQNIKIYLNKKLFAHGELLVLENGSLAVEVSQINHGLVGNTD